MTIDKNYQWEEYEVGGTCRSNEGEEELVQAIAGKARGKESTN
jgi:hypothetical protein